MTRNILLFAMALWALLPQTGQSQYATGLLMDDESYSSQPSLPRSLKFTETTLPTAYSLKKHCPTPGNQGQMGSCVGWAAAYGALTIANAHRNAVADKAQITIAARSALYVYNQIKIGPCNSGSYLHDAFPVMKEKGAPKKVDFHPNDCYVQPDASVHAKAAELRIKDHNILFGMDENPEVKVLKTMSSLAANKPVVIGMLLTNSFFRIGPDGYWRPSPQESTGGGHAMCVIGYDNINKKFEILNSWGTAFGNGGYLTISYDDYAKYCKYGYQFNLQDNQPAVTFNFKAGFKINKLKGYNSDKGAFVFEALPAARTGAYYTLPPGAIRKGEHFKVLANGMSKDTYLYIFSLKPDGSSELLFPASEPKTFASTVVSILPLIPSNNSYVEIPADTTKAIMADFAGDDYLVYLFSSKQIEGFDARLQQMSNASGDVYARLRQVFQDCLVPESSVRYASDSMSFSGTANTGYAVPLVLKVSVIE